MHFGGLLPDRQLLRDRGCDAQGSGVALTRRASLSIRWSPDPLVKLRRGLAARVRDCRGDL